MNKKINNDNSYQPLTPEQEKTYLTFIKESDAYHDLYNPIYILFHTGIRISEFCGLTFADVDLKNCLLSVRRTMVHTKKDGFHFGSQKIFYMDRAIPMAKEVCECFRSLMKSRTFIKDEPIVDGVSGFIYLEGGEPTYPRIWMNHFNDIYKDFIKQTGIYDFPRVSAFTCRCTFLINNSFLET